MYALTLVFSYFWLWILPALLLAGYLYFTWRFNELKSQGINGPPPIPVLGNLLLMFKEGFFNLDEVMMKKYGKIYSFFDGRNPTMIVGDPDIAKQVLVKDFSNFVNRRRLYLRGIMANSVLDARDEHWKYIRSFISPAFSGGKLRLMCRLIDSAADNLLSALKEKAEKKEDVDVLKVCGNFTMEVIASTGFGIGIDTQKEANHPFVKYAMKIFGGARLSFKVIIGAFLTSLAPFFELFGMSMFPEDSLQFFRREITEALDARRKGLLNRPDFLNILVEAERDSQKQENTHDKKDLTGFNSKKKGLTEDEIIAQAILFLAAGYQTTSVVLSYLLYNLAVHPECQEKLLKEIDEKMPLGVQPDYDNIKSLSYLQQCIDETLRIDPPATRLDRRASEDTYLGGVKVPKGMVVSIAVTVLHKDPEFWPEPDKFDPERFTPEQKSSRHPFSYMPFGQGPRNCVATRLAYVELKMAAIRVLQQYRILRSPSTRVPLQKDKKTIHGNALIELKVEKRR